jgi:hypothetical protein
MAEKIIHVEYRPESGKYIAYDPFHETATAEGTSVESAAVELLKDRPHVYRVVITDLARSGIGTRAKIIGAGIRDITVFGENREGSYGFRAKIGSSGLPRFESFALQAPNAVFNLIYGNYAIFRIDFDLSHTKSSPAETGEADDFLVIAWSR